MEIVVSGLGWRMLGITFLSKPSLKFRITSRLSIQIRLNTMTWLCVSSTNTKPQLEIITLQTGT